ncbi:LLM class flavin-dependent oxidoreductase [Natronolimnohabitans innermongolicus]|uniref:Luciferase-like protein n=1 Tax=Natronolimnohabitans innermongolicus JCM 12255 TaxID=1227499 RepID=L9WLW2_9EURY|nr:LLM class flavin-dependent oxidoreductase [Natronolimnohabitans innermongolicus]ELY50372.1 luciferase-like protein [Natronolimnohabitans innermongolicus JCM 12255]
MTDYGYLLPTRGAVLTSDDEHTLTAKTAADVLGLARRAEAAGFRSVWVGDSVLAKPRHEPLSTLAAIAAETDAVYLGTAVYLPDLRNPVHVAHQAATVDQLSGGRLRLGVGVGIGPDVEAEYENLDRSFHERGARTNELLEIATELWDGSAVDHSGEYYDLEDASIGFEPVGELPIYVASAAFDPSDGFPKLIEERLRRYGDGWLPIAVGPEQYREGVAEIETMLEESGRSSETFHGGVYLDVVIDDDESRAIDTARSFYERYYPAWPSLSDEQVRSKGAFGSIETVRETIEAYEAAGVETITVRFTTDTQREQFRKFAPLV